MACPTMLESLADAPLGKFIADTPKLQSFREALKSFGSSLVHVVSARRKDRRRGHKRSIGI